MHSIAAGLVICFLLGYELIAVISSKNYSRLHQSRPIRRAGDIRTNRKAIDLAVFSRGSSFFVFKGLSRGIVVGSGVINYCWVSYLEGGKLTLVQGLP